jgi:tRNA(Ile)-lysidine synthase
MDRKGGDRFSEQVMPTQAMSSVSVAEAKALFSGLEDLPAVVLAVSGGPDSTALMWLAARWQKSLKRKPDMIAVTIDHALRPESAREAAAVKRLATALGITHRVLRWRGRKPQTGLQQAARHARYALLAQAAREAGAMHIVTAHTLDDQAETVLIRMSRGSGLTGLAAMAQVSRLPNGMSHIALHRPLLDIPKSRLIATLRAANIAFADDPSNRNPRFARVRLRGLMEGLVREGLDAPRLSVLARRLRRADAAIEAVVDRAAAALGDATQKTGSIVFPLQKLAGLPVEIVLRLIGRAVAQVGDEGPVELGKLEALTGALEAAQAAEEPRFRRTLAGAIVTLAGGQLAVERAPPRQGGKDRKALTKGRGGKVKRPEKR